MIFPPLLILGNGLLSRCFRLFVLQVVWYYIRPKNIFFGFAAVDYRGPITGDRRRFLKKTWSHFSVGDTGVLNLFHGRL
jgi:hypothetical protein